MSLATFDEVHKLEEGECPEGRAYDSFPLRTFVHTDADGDDEDALLDVLQTTLNTWRRQQRRGASSVREAAALVERTRAAYRRTHVQEPLLRQPTFEQMCQAAAKCVHDEYTAMHACNAATAAGTCEERHRKPEAVVAQFVRLVQRHMHMYALADATQCTVQCMKKHLLVCLCQRMRLYACARHAHVHECTPRTYACPVTYTGGKDLNVMCVFSGTSLGTEHVPHGFDLSYRDTLFSSRARYMYGAARRAHSAAGGTFRNNATSSAPPQPQPKAAVEREYTDMVREHVGDEDFSSAEESTPKEAPAAMSDERAAEEAKAYLLPQVYDQVLAMKRAALEVGYERMRACVGRVLEELVYDTSLSQRIAERMRHDAERTAEARLHAVVADAATRVVAINVHDVLTALAEARATEATASVLHARETRVRDAQQRDRIIRRVVALWTECHRLLPSASSAATASSSSKAGRTAAPSPSDAGMCTLRQFTTAVLYGMAQPNGVRHETYGALLAAEAELAYAMPRREHLRYLAETANHTTFAAAAAELKQGSVAKTRLKTVEQRSRRRALVQKTLRAGSAKRRGEARQSSAVLRALEDQALHARADTPFTASRSLRIYVPAQRTVRIMTEHSCTPYYMREPMVGHAGVAAGTYTDADVTRGSQFLYARIHAMGAGAFRLLHEKLQ